MKRYRSAVAGLLMAMVFGFATIGQGATPLKVLVFTKVASGWNTHASIPAGIACIRALGTQNGFTVDTTVESSSFTTANLSQYGTLIFLNAAGSVFDTSQRSAIVSYMAAGGGFIALHYSVYLDSGWSWYGSLNGGREATYSIASYANIRENPTHFIARNLSDTMRRNDEYYTYKADPRTNVPNITVIYSASFSNKTSYPTAWCHPYGGGRAFFTTLGHWDTTFNDANYRKLLANAILWTSGRDSVTSVKGGSTPARSEANSLVSVTRVSGKPAIVIHHEGTFKLCVYDICGREVSRSIVTGNHAVAIRGPAGLKMAVVREKSGAVLCRRKIIE